MFWRRSVASDSVILQVIEIPTASALLATKAREERRGPLLSTVAQLRADFWQGVEAAMQGGRLPPAAQLTGYRVMAGSSESLRVVVCYLGDRDIEPDAQALIADEFRARFAIPAAPVSYERVQSSFGPLVFRRNQATLPVNVSGLLDQIAQMLNQYPELRAEIIAQADQPERERIKITAGADAARSVVVRLVKANQVQ
jgi:hypothetical protein